MLEIDSENFEEIYTTDKLVVLDFWASWCQPCKDMLPIFEEISNEIGDKVIMAKIKVDDNRDIAKKFRVMSVPCLILMKNGEIVEFSPGLTTKEMILSKINLHI